LALAGVVCGSERGKEAATPNRWATSPSGRGSLEAFPWPSLPGGAPLCFRFPTSLAGLLSLLAPAFTQPTFQTFCMLMVGMIGRVRDCTVTGMLQAAGLAGVWHHSRAHDFFATRN
jgi:hypothetical protein